MGYTIVGQVAALIGGGVAISKWQPRAKFIAIWNIFASLLFICGIFAMSFINCERSPWIEKGIVCLREASCPNQMIIY